MFKFGGNNRTSEDVSYLPKYTAVMSSRLSRAPKIMTSFDPKGTERLRKRMAEYDKKHPFKALKRKFKEKTKWLFWAFSLKKTAYFWCCVAYAEMLQSIFVRNFFCFQCDVFCISRDAVQISFPSVYKIIVLPPKPWYIKENWQIENLRVVCVFLISQKTFSLIVLVYLLF